MTKMKLSPLIFLFCILCFSAFADTVKPDTHFSEQQQLQALYAERIQRLFVELVSNKEKYRNINALRGLAQSEILNHWDLESSLIGMIGHTLWRQQSPESKQALIQAFKETLCRYFIEAYGYYSGQPVTVQSVKLNAGHTKGWVSLSIDVDYMPDLSIDIQISKNQQWQFRDIRIQGISYTQMKRSYFQSTIKQDGVQELIKQLMIKNNEFYASININRLGTPNNG